MTRAKTWPILPAGIAMTACFVVPMAYILAVSLEPAPDVSDVRFFRYIAFFTDAYFATIAFRTLALGIGVTAAVLALGYPVAYFLSRMTSRLRTLVQAIVFFPLITSAIVRTFGWMIIISDGGFLNLLLQFLGLEPVKLLFKDAGIFIGLTHILLPFMILTLLGTLNGIDPNLESAAISLGSSPFRAFRRVVLPMSVPGIVSGSLLVFALAVSAFVTPALLGGVQTPVMATMIYREAVVNYDIPAAAAGAIILLVTTLVLVHFYHVVLKSRARQVTQ